MEAGKLSPMDRMEILRSFFKKTGFILEIGPSYNPVAPKSQGYNVETVDYICADDLKKKYKDDPSIDISRIEEVDYVTGGGRLTNLIKNKKYDYIIASHVIEHVPDIITYLKDCESLLKENGVLILAIPDKRFCFDVYQSLTSTGDVLQAYFEQRTKHHIGKIFDHFAYNAYNDGRLAWSQDELGSLKLTNSISEATQLFNKKKESTEYFDIHGWRFTPASFRLIINDLYEAGYTKLRESNFHDTVRFEFFLTMSRYGNGCGKSRQTLFTEAYDDNFRGEATITNKNVSVVIPVYNGKQYLKKAIESVVRQTLPADEIIVIDDGSTDDSALVIAELAKVYPLKFFQKENGGQSSARNYGVSVSSGELIAFLDQDDIWYPNHIEELVRPFLKNFYPEIGWVYSTVDEIGENDQLYCIDSLAYGASVHPKKTIYECLATDMFVIPSATIVSRKAFDDVGGFDEQLSGYEDDDLFVRIFSKGYGNVFINKSTSQWRTHRTSCSRSSKMAISRIIYANKLLKEYQDDHERSIKYYNIILSRFITIITNEYSKAIIIGDKNYAKQMHDDLHKLYLYMKFPLRLNCNLQLFVFRHQLLRSILSPLARIYRFTQRLIQKKS